MAALRERDDLECLAEQLLERIALREGLPDRRVPPSVRARWLAFDWPGNVRQLEAVLRRLLVSGDAGLPAGPGGEHLRVGIAQRGTPETTTLQAHLDHERHACIRKAVAETAGDKDEAARRFGIRRATLYRELRRSPP